jgi:hypothetical protein
LVAKESEQHTNSIADGKHIDFLKKKNVWKAVAAPKNT